MSGLRWVILFLVVNIFMWQKGNPNPGSRLATLAAMSQHNTFQIDPYVSAPLGWTNDWSRGPDGHFYSNKAPGPMLVAYPVFWLLDHLSLRGISDPYDRQRQERLDLPIYNAVLSDLFQVFPFAILTLLALARLRRSGVSHDGLQIAAAAMLFGNTASLLMNTYFGHGMAAVALLACVLSATEGWTGWASFFIGWAALCDYGVLVVIPFFVALIVWRQSSRLQALKAAIAGSALPAALWIFYHTCCFGRPWRIPLAYQSPEFTDLAHAHHSMWGIAHLVPQVGVGVQLILGTSRGLIVTQPWILIVIPILALAFYERRIRNEWKNGLGFVLCGFIGLFLMNMTFGEWHGGMTIGPRYMSSILPLFGIALGLVWTPLTASLKAAAAMTVGISLIFSALVFSTTLYVPPGHALWPALIDYWRHASPSGVSLRFFLLLAGFLWATLARPPRWAPAALGYDDVLEPASSGPDPLFSLLVPTYNEAENIIPMVDAAHAVLGDHPHEILVVDDNSPDGTSKIVEQYSTSRPWLRVHTRMNARGLSGAVLEGITQTQGKWIGVMDADLSHDERLLPELLTALREGADLAIGSRRVPGGGADHWPWYRRFTSDIATKMAEVSLGIPLSDPMSGYFVFRREVYDRCHERLHTEGYKILLELYCLGRPRTVREFPFVFRDRRQGYSKLNDQVMRQYLWSLWRLRQYM